MTSHLKARLERLDRSLPRASQEDVETLRVLVERLDSEVERWASQQPNYLPPLGSSCVIGFSRLDVHLRSPGWREYQHETQTAALSQMIAIYVSGNASGPRPEQPPWETTLGDVARCLARIEASGAPPPPWMPAALVGDARKRSALAKEINGMNSEEREKETARLLAKARITGRPDPSGAE
jgi:hypothetical protein